MNFIIKNQVLSWRLFIFLQILPSGLIKYLYLYRRITKLKIFLSSCETERTQTLRPLLKLIFHRLTSAKIELVTMTSKDSFSKSYFVLLANMIVWFSHLNALPSLIKVRYDSYMATVSISQQFLYHFQFKWWN